MHKPGLYVQAGYSKIYDAAGRRLYILTSQERSYAARTFRARTERFCSNSPYQERLNRSRMHRPGLYVQTEYLKIQ